MNIDPHSTDRVRIDYSRVSEYLGPVVEKPSFWDRIKKGLATMGSFAGTMAQFVGPLFGPFGILAGAAGYGVKNVSNRALWTISSREQYDLATSAQPGTVATPGFMDGQASLDSMPFVAPSYLTPQIEDVVIQNEASKQTMMHSL